MFISVGTVNKATLSLAPKPQICLVLPLFLHSFAFKLAIVSFGHNVKAPTVSSEVRHKSEEGRLCFVIAMERKFQCHLNL